MRRNNAKPDVRLKDFWRSNDRFADLFNAVLFNGQEILKPDALEEADTDVSGIIQLKRYEESLVRARDVVKKTAYGADFVIWGIENQQRIHYASPLRTLLYDGMGYLKEYNEITRMRKEDTESKTRDEFLSKMRKEDRLHPIFSITVYYGEKEWDGPLCLKDMIVDMPDSMAGLFADYRMNLVQVLDSDRYSFKNEDVKAVFDVSREFFHGNINTVKERYKDKELQPDVVAVIGKVTESSFLMQKGKRERGPINMCTALEQWLQKEGKKEFKKGEKQGLEKGLVQRDRELILKWTAAGYQTTWIADLLGYSEEEVRKVQNEKTTVDVC
ncbi:MAG: hypothetical protein LUF30_04425 [Lachnospiraceae bacterium]|nr:hypothetical protein [Lachnospiraceae bacterium]